MALDTNTGPQLAAAAARGDLRALGKLLLELSNRMDTISETELGYIDGITAGASAASKALVLDANGLLNGAYPIRRAYKAITLANLQALAGTPIEIIAAPAAGKMHLVHAWRFRLVFVGTAIDDAATDGNLILLYAGGGTIDTMEADGLVDATAHTQGFANVLTELIAADTALSAKAVQISNDGAEYTIVGGGDCTAEVEVYYRTVDVDIAA